MLDRMDVDECTVIKLWCIVQALLGGLMPKFIDRAGQRFGRLLVLEEAGRNQLKKVIWNIGFVQQKTI